MPTTVALGPATVKTRTKGPDGKSHASDAPNSIVFATNISAENAGGLPVDTKRGTATLEISPSDVQVAQFADYAELRATAGDQYESTTLALYNEKARNAAWLNVKRATAKATLAPSNVLTYIQSKFAEFSLASLFEVATQSKAVRVGKKTQAVQQIEAIQSGLASMSREELEAKLAEISKLLGK